jgi:hypothetical protein
MTLADCAYPKTEESFLFLWCLCVYARSAVSAKAQATSATAVSNCLEYLKPAANQFELMVLNMHDPAESRTGVDLAVSAVADRTAFWVYDRLVFNGPAEASSIHVHLAPPNFCCELKRHTVSRSIKGRSATDRANKGRPALTCRSSNIGLAAVRPVEPDSRCNCSISTLRGHIKRNWAKPLAKNGPKVAFYASSNSGTNFQFLGT